MQIQRPRRNVVSNFVELVQRSTSKVASDGGVYPELLHSPRFLVARQFVLVINDVGFQHVFSTNQDRAWMSNAPARYPSQVWRRQCVCRPTPESLCLVSYCTQGNYRYKPRVAAAALASIGQVFRSKGAFIPPSRAVDRDGGAARAGHLRCGLMKSGRGDKIMEWVCLGCTPYVLCWGRAGYTADRANGPAFDAETSTGSMADKFMEMIARYV